MFLVSVYPNPTRNITIVKVELSEELPIEISISNVIGESVIEKAIDTGRNFTRALDMSNLPAGIYLLKVRYGTNYIIKRLVKE